MEDSRFRPGPTHDGHLVVLNIAAMYVLLQTQALFSNSLLNTSLTCWTGSSFFKK